MAGLSDVEITMKDDSVMQNGYTFVRKGNVYITKNCRKLAHEAGKPVYIVENEKKAQVGIRVPQYIYQQVRKANLETRDVRAEAVMKKDLALESRVRVEVFKLYPKIPAFEVESLLKHTLKKRSGRVGRQKEMAIGDLVDLAVRARIRHLHTEYDSMLRHGMDREKARDAIRGAVDRKVEQWGGKNRGVRRKPMTTAGTKTKMNKQHSMLKSSSEKRMDGSDRKSKPMPTPAPSVEPRQKSALLRRSSLRVKEAQERDYSEELDLMELD